MDSLSKCEFCLEQFDGDQLIQCLHCGKRFCEQCITPCTFPADWFDCCALHWSKCPHKDISLIFCSSQCRTSYMKAYDEQMKARRQAGE